MGEQRGDLRNLSPRAPCASRIPLHQQLARVEQSGRRICAAKFADSSAALVSVSK
jgi:hypothetical protein